MKDNKGTRKERQFKEESSVTEENVLRTGAVFFVYLSFFLFFWFTIGVFLYFVHTTNATELDTALSNNQQWAIYSLQ